MNKIVEKPHWESQHDGWVSDIMFFSEQKNNFILMLRKNPGNEQFIRLIHGLDKLIQKAQSAYKKQYGTRMNLRKSNEA